MSRDDAQVQAVQHLQTAAIEAIKAMRSFLDLAESLVQSPETAATVAKAFAEAAANAVRPSTLAPDPAPEAESEEQGRSGVRRIDVD